jgi:hypothetical protein
MCQGMKKYGNTKIELQNYLLKNIISVKKTCQAVKTLKIKVQNYYTKTVH